jgi:hypothetical protein
MNSRPSSRGLLLLAIALSVACAFYPKKSENFDRPTCAEYRHPLALEATDMGLYCHGDARACFAGYALLPAATALASGGIVLAGNGMYWLGNRTHCSIRAYARNHWYSNAPRQGEAK